MGSGRAAEQVRKPTAVTAVPQRGLRHTTDVTVTLAVEGPKTALSYTGFVVSLLRWLQVEPAPVIA